MDRLENVVTTASSTDQEKALKTRAHEVSIPDAKVYKTTMLFKTSTLPAILLHSLSQFKQVAFGKWDAKQANLLGRCLANCIKLHELKVKPGKNQMMLKVGDTSNAQEGVSQTISQFCSPENINHILQVMKEGEKIQDGILALVIQILNSPASENAFTNDQALEALSQTATDLLS